jgi:4-amino-4-deoxy-L-arabinose transferase-like glycosyltransferase
MHSVGIAPAATPRERRTRRASRSYSARLGWLALGSVLLLACVLRLWKIQDVPGNVFYDAAVRSMSGSWHNFFFGALEPSGTVSIDKPPVDLWLQVATTRVLGFGLVGLHIPEALGGVAACGLLFGALRRPFGFAAALAAALALAVLPLSVLTARSDTMDSVLAALEIAALWLSWRALKTGRMRWSLAAAAVMGLAFNVKLTEMLIALPAMALLWLWAATPGMRVRAVLGTAATFVLAALSWTAIASLTPLSARPFPIGSSNGSIWHVTLVYDGLSRLSSQGATGGAEGGAGPLRLLSAGPMQYWTLIGIALLATCLLALVALAVLIATDRERLRAALREPAGRLVLGILVWFATGLIAFSAMERLQPRYLDAFAPAVCALFGLSLSVLWRGGLGRPSDRGESTSSGELDFNGARLNGTALASRVALVCVGIGLLAIALSKDSYIVGRARTDSLLTDFSTPSLSRYLHAHRDGAHYEVASANVDDVSGLIARDNQPVLILNSVDGSLTRTKSLEAQVAEGRVRFYFASPSACHAGRHCAGNQKWAFAHSAPVPGQPDLRRFTAP